MKQRISVQPLNLRGILGILDNIRAQDWIEISNLVPRYMAERHEFIAMHIMQMGGIGFVLSLDDRPVCMVHAVQRFEGSWSIGMIATDDFPRVFRFVIKEGVAIMAPVLREAGARYMDAYVYADNSDARRLLARCGFRRASRRLTNYGAFGKDFYLYTLSREDAENVPWFKTSSTASARAD